jgi:transitional endoplasmic reticulum ATPase
MKTRHGHILKSRNAKLTDSEKSQRFVRKKIAVYLDRILSRYVRLDQEVLTFVHWLLGPELLEDLVHYVVPMLGKEDKAKFETDMEEAFSDGYNFAQSLERLLKKYRSDLGTGMTPQIRQLLKKRIKSLHYCGNSELEKSLVLFRKMFRLTKLEAEICLLLFIIAEWYSCETYFEDHLRCTYYSGRNYLSTMLGTSSAEVTTALNGGLTKTGMLELDGGNRLCLNSSIDGLFRKPAGSEVTTTFFRRIHPKPVHLSSHHVDSGVTDHILRILSVRSGDPTHVLLYGPPGTGKTSYAHGIGRKLKLPMYEVEHGGKDTDGQRLAAITACLNMTRLGAGSLVVADDSDPILNTGANSDSMGEFSDKKRLHDILEEQDVRMIWIVNSTENIEESVLRRFSFSLPFRSFSKAQRAELWTNVLRRHRCKRYFSSSDISHLAERFQCSPGVIDQAVRNAKNAKPSTKAGFHKAVSLALEAFEGLSREGRPRAHRHRLDPEFVVEGLNVKGEKPVALLKELKSFDKYLRSLNNGEHFTMRLLFYGPPGTGKSHFARYIANELDREIIRKSGSDLLSKWVGETEKNIRDAYYEAESREAVLIFDEADSLILNRGQTSHSWEASMTNEFLARMEEFRGIQIFTTNRLTHLDAASMRRFNHKVQFHYLTAKGNRLMYATILAPLVQRPVTGKVEMDLKLLTRLTPGDFKTVKDRFVFREREDITHEALLAALREEERIKAVHAGEKSIGFMA